MAAKEAMRVLAASPKWIPGKQNGRNVRMKYVAPINFSTATTAQFSIGTDTSKRPIDGSPADLNAHKIMVITVPKDTSKNLGFTIRKNVKNLNSSAPLYYIDGKPANELALLNLPPKKIKSVTVYTGASATQKYGPLVKNNVIDVITLPNKPEKQ